MPSTFWNAHPSRRDLRGPAAAVAAGVAAVALGPVVEPGPTASGALHALAVGTTMTGAVSLVQHWLKDGSDVHTTRERNDVAAVIKRRSLHAVAQPIVDLTDGRVVGAEMLARFEVEPAAPQHWFEAAAAVGRLQDLELVAVDEALEAARHLPASLFISINVSPGTLCARALHTAIAAGPVDPRRVILELTEHEQIEDYESLQRALVPLRAMGVRLAVDDAGAGYSTFRHILNLKPHTIKVDRGLVTDIHADPGRRALAAAIVMFALEMNAKVTAEGVETDAEMQTLQLLGMDSAQGYLLGRPTRERSVWSSWAQTRREVVLP